MIRIATKEDFDLVLNMALKFSASSPYAKYTDVDKLKILIETFLEEDRSKSIILLHSDKGMLAAIVTPFLFGNIKLSTEVGWWVEPEARGLKIGKELLDAYEYWAKQVGCSLVTMSSLDDSVGKYYEMNGYTLYERAYIKEIV